MSDAPITPERIEALLAGEYPGDRDEEKRNHVRNWTARSDNLEVR